MKTKLIATDVGDFIGRETLYIEMKKPYWMTYQLNWWKLFFSLACWLPWKNTREDYVSPVTAWRVCDIIHNYRNDRLLWLNASKEQGR